MVQLVFNENVVSKSPFPPLLQFCASCLGGFPKLSFQIKDAGEALALFSAMPTSTTTFMDLDRTASRHVRCRRPQGQHGMCDPITTTPPTTQERPRSGGTMSENILSQVKQSTTSRACSLIGGLSASSSAALYTRRCAFYFERESMPPPNQACAYPSYITCCMREKHTRAHTLPLLPV